MCVPLLCQTFGTKPRYSNPFLAGFTVKSDNIIIIIVYFSVRENVSDKQNDLQAVLHSCLEMIRGVVKSTKPATIICSVGFSTADSDWNRNGSKLRPRVSDCHRVWLTGAARHLKIYSNIWYQIKQWRRDQNEEQNVTPNSWRSSLDTAVSVRTHTRLTLLSSWKP